MSNCSVTYIIGLLLGDVWYLGQFGRSRGDPGGGGGPQSGQAGQGRGGVGSPQRALLGQMVDKTEPRNYWTKYLTWITVKHLEKTS